MRRKGRALAGLAARAPLLPAVAFWALLLGACGGSNQGASCRGTCSDSSGAAALVRWRIMDALTGTPVARCTGGGGQDGSCCARIGEDPGTGMRGHDVVIDFLRLRTQIVNDDGTLTDQPCASCTFRCTPNEWTTCFELPPATYKLTLEAYSCGRPIGQTPVPLLRSLGSGDLTNLQVQSVLLSPSDALDRCGGERCPHGSGSACPVLPDMSIVPDSAGVSDASVGDDAGSAADAGSAVDASSLVDAACVP